MILFHLNHHFMFQLQARLRALPEGNNAQVRVVSANAVNTGRVSIIHQF